MNITFKSQHHSSFIFYDTLSPLHPTSYMWPFPSNIRSRRRCVAQAISVPLLPPSYTEFTPIVERLSVSQATQHQYCRVEVIGQRFWPPAIGTTDVMFDNRPVAAVTFHHSQLISFLIPLDATVGTHEVRVRNVYNNTLSTRSPLPEPGISLFSNATPFYIVSPIPS